MSKKKVELSFEEKLRRLEEIVALLDLGSDPLEKQIELYEEGLTIAEDCRSYLSKAEQKIITLGNKPSEELS